MPANNEAQVNNEFDEKFNNKANDNINNKLLDQELIDNTQNSAVEKLKTQVNQLTNNNIISLEEFKNNKGILKNDSLINNLNNTNSTKQSLIIKESNNLNTKTKKRIGEILIENNLITQEQLNEALAEAKESGSKIGEVLAAKGLIPERTLYEHLASQWNLEYLDEDPQENIKMELPTELVWKLQIFPVSLKNNCLTIAISNPLEEDKIKILSSSLNREIKQVITSPRRVKYFITKLYGKEGLHRATYRLKEIEPENSASFVFSKSQKITFFSSLFFLALSFYFMTTLTGIILVSAIILYYGLNSGYKFKLAINSLSGSGNVPINQEEIDNIKDKELPLYTILVPLYKESEIVELLTENIKQLNYPSSKLEVLLLCEEDDDETINAIKSSKLPDNYYLIEVPDALPKTKPKACNYGLLLSRGEIVVIYDAEDKPDPDQLKKVYLAFNKSSDDIACIQAKLNYFNRSQNLLTKWFSAEYALWFDLVLPGLHYNSHPISLGGTSNHFKMNVLRELDAWDPYNVTEDADLGIRLWKLGYTTAIVDSVTLEEANSQLKNWIRQRSRWIKGYIQTWLVHMRHPIKLYKDIGLTSFLSLQMTVGGILVTLFNPLLWVLSIIFIVLNPDWLNAFYPGPIFYCALALLIVGNFFHFYLYIVGLARRRYYDIIGSVLFVPLYWFIMSIAGWKGFIQLFTKPFYWEKTDHGLVDHNNYVNNETGVNNEQ